MEMLFPLLTVPSRCAENLRIPSQDGYYIQQNNLKCLYMVKFEPPYIIGESQHNVLDGALEKDSEDLNRIPS